MSAATQAEGGARPVDLVADLQPARTALDSTMGMVLRLTRAEHLSKAAARQRNPQRQRP